MNKEHPILFSAPMVRAILDGRKTQTRRVMKPQPQGELRPLEEWSRGLAAAFHDHAPDLKKVDAHASRLAGRVFPFTTPSGVLMSPICPYGDPGDRLFVRETGWERPERTRRMRREGADTWERYYYDADGLVDTDHEQFKEWGFKRRPAIHMPRWASRITLEVTGVRVERLQEIGEEDAKAEGVPAMAWEDDEDNDCYRAGFAATWMNINAKRAPWKSNPWVWVIEFKRAS